MGGPNLIEIVTLQEEEETAENSMCMHREKARRKHREKGPPTIYREQLHQKPTLLAL